MQSTLGAGRGGLHAAVIMDGNGRWATARGLPRVAGHRAGARAVRRVVEAAPGLGIATLTLYAFSSDNWQRPPREVGALMRLFRSYLASETAKLIENGVRLTVIGRRDRLPDVLARAIAGAEEATAGGHRLHLRLAIDYSARDALVRAAALAAGREVERGEFAALLGTAAGAAEPAPDVDLLIRSGGEQRLSDFLLWECAYAELYFTPRQWPDFDAAALAEAVAEFHHRERRFGRVMEKSA
ncbi:di-trans,poly-cis-decaprenylcistransferase [Longimicrobium sp.]|uniref:di-trans,poly-cis-decaprenylcistransferase n=1 Tax=Longimicrobium sp. TaxID=2029185 RepID=UPI002CC145D1|nr:di-trans,poly-cis-decaprenylcistransferase [Longimicrobium sp.]HSU13890.1 di-trans,poly-cis-decaprenylcistransferase [Longimicrobium sp.]